MIIIGIVSFVIGTRCQLSTFNKIISIFPNRICANRFFIFIFFITVTVIILFFNNFKLYNLLFRGFVQEFSESDNIAITQLEGLIIDNFIRPMPFMILAACVYVHKLKNQSLINNQAITSFLFSSIFLFFLLVASVILVAPTSVPRFQVGALYIALLLMFTHFWDKPYRMQTSIVGGLLFLMPFLDKFRRFDPEKFNLSVHLDSLTAGHFDAYQNFSRVIEIELITNGRLLLGTLLFFVPRSLWEDKPIGSGHLLARVADYSFSKVKCEGV